MTTPPPTTTLAEPLFPDTALLRAPERARDWMAPIIGQEDGVKISVCACRCLLSCLFFGAPSWKVTLGYATSMFVAYTFKSGKRANELRSLIPRYALPMQFQHFIEYILIKIGRA